MLLKKNKTIDIKVCINVHIQNKQNTKKVKLITADDKKKAQHNE